MLYSKNGSIPKTETDGTDGWVEIEEPPVVPEGKEVVWWYPPGWVVRDPKPADTDTTTWSWSQSEEKWVEVNKPDIVIDSGNITIDPVPSASPEIAINLGTASAASTTEI